MAIGHHAGDCRPQDRGLAVRSEDSDGRTLASSRNGEPSTAPRSPARPMIRPHVSRRGATAGIGEIDVAWLRGRWVTIVEID